MNITLISSREDKKWLRDVHLPRLKSGQYGVAILYGNEDAPNRIEVFPRGARHGDKPTQVWTRDDRIDGMVLQ